MKDTSLYLKLMFVKVVQYLEICALPYLAGIGMAVGMKWRMPEEIWSKLSTAGVIGVILILYVPIAILHGLYLVQLKKKSPKYCYSFFLEDNLGERGFTRALAILAAICSFGFGILNYNFAIDVSDPHHLSKFVAKPWETNHVAVTGEIVREPEFRDFNVWLYIKPSEIEVEEGGQKRKEPVGGGLLLAKVARTVEGYEEFDYGQIVRLTGPLREPEPATNPGAFDYKRHLNNRNIFGLMNINREIYIEDLGHSEVNPVFKVSFWVKEKFLGIMKRTLPYPHSSFQGGIIYGLRTGLPPDQLFEFKWAGMAWVLVVAGAHLLMVYLTLKMILESIRPNPKLGFTVLFSMLFMFLILTGINPPTVRAFIMLFLYEFTKTFLGQDIRSAVRSAISIAACLLLASHVYPYFSPLMIFDPTVTLSFGAVLSLSFLSRPIERVLRRYCYGVTSVVVLLGVIAALMVTSVLRAPTLSLLGEQLLPIGVLTLILAVITIRINNRYREKYHFDRVFLGYNDPSLFRGRLKWIHPDFLSYNHLPKWILAFLGAQVAIQFGMVMPLSSWYFQRSPVGGLLANLIAFPALGVIIQVGLVAVLIGMIPVIGLPLAFILNAADYLGIKLLMGIAHYSKVLFPYPMAMKPDASQILLYYGLLIGFVFFDKIFYSPDKRGYLTLKELFEEKYLLTKNETYGRLLKMVDTSKKNSAVLAAFFVALLGAGWWMGQGMKIDHLRVIVMELDEGSGTIIETAGGSRFLVDGGKVDWRGTFDVGERTISPILLNQQIEHLDAVFVTSLKPENIGGLSFILENFSVGQVFVPFDPAVLASRTEFTAEEYAKIGGRSSQRRSDNQIIESVDRMRRVIRTKNIPVTRLAAGTSLLKTGPFQMEVLNPPGSPVESSNQMGNNGIVLRLTYGPNSILLAGDLDADGERALLARTTNLKSKFLLIPSHGSSSASTEAFANAIDPDYAAVQYRRPPFRRGTDMEKISDILKRYAAAGARVYRTDLNGAITIDAWADGRFNVTPMLSTAISENEGAGDQESDTDVQERSLLKSEGTGL